ncbi:cyanate lyase C-terminal domain-containing protein [Kickxella alabastrina]|uniref:cyanate lyase C-terminal domain-containing protein n=1 Tax=Kickxella alabastrina TaxID=61397 RepID=UPI00221F9A0C|nr:cyanate lyase C-terminal domain-containing protein [Kickxella alabastrina]KAI7833431.1 cyanate lyase C-terminal domain-containing protein [Kickxella alabastrina]
MNNIDSLPPACSKLLHEKSRRKLSFAQIAEHLSHDEVWTAALFYGRATPTLKDIHALADMLNLSPQTLEDDFRTAGPPLREVNISSATDPVIYPFQEAIALYGPAIRSVVVEKMGDGAVSVPDMKVRVEKVPRGRDDNVRLILESKYTLYKSW